MKKKKNIEEKNQLKMEISWVFVGVFFVVSTYVHAEADPDAEPEAMLLGKFFQSQTQASSQPSSNTVTVRRCRCR